MKDFDASWASRRAKENRTFKVCGEEFVMVEAARPESLAADPEETGDEVADSMKVLDDRFLSLIEHSDPDPGETVSPEEKKYRELRARETDGLSIRDLREVIEWLVEEQTGRPTTSPTDSTSGRERSGTRSMAGSRSPATARG